MSPLFALPPADLPTMAYVAPTGIHATVRDRSHTVREGDTVYDVAQRHGVSVEAVVRANSLPQGGRWVLPGTVLRIPAGSGSASAAPAPSSSSGSSARSSSGTHTVRAGDTLTGIAARHGVTVGALARANDISTQSFIHPGQKLRLPGSSSPSRSGSGSGSGSGSSAPSRSSSSSSGTHTVRAGDTLTGIAARHGVTVGALARANDISTQSFIHPGQKLRLPGSGSSDRSSSPSRSGSGPRPTATPTRPYDEASIGDRYLGEALDNTFLHYTYSSATARSARANREHLASVDVPSRAQVRAMIEETAARHGVDPDLMVALSFQESGWNHRAVSPANAIGAMQVIPSSGQWASALVGRDLNLLDPQDNITAGVVIMRALQRSADSGDHAIGGYYQGLASVRQHGLFPDTQQYVRNIRSLMRTL